jgi:sec-independent protein translocase protein TatB
MFDFGVGYTELLVIAVVALLVVGPKDLPKLLRHLGRFTASVRRMAAEFQRHLDEVAREADVDKVTSEIREATRFDLGEADMRKAAADLRSALENTAPAADPHAPPPHPPASQVPAAPPAVAEGAALPPAPEPPPPEVPPQPEAAEKAEPAEKVEPAEKAPEKAL